MTYETHRDIIAMFGGNQAFRARLAERGYSVALVTVRSWTAARRFVPTRYWVTMMEMAADMGIKLSADDILNAVPVVALRPLTSPRRRPPSATSEPCP